MTGIIYLLMAVSWFASAIYHELSGLGPAYTEALISIAFLALYEARQISAAINKRGAP